MRQLKIQLLSLLVGLTFLFNVERLDVGAQNVLDIQSFVYVLATFVTIVILLMPTFARNRITLTIAFTLGLYFICKLFLFNDRPLIEGFYIYVTITEIAFLSFIALTAQRLSQHLVKFQEGLEVMTLALGGKHLQTVTKAASDIRRELTRSRHYHRPLSVIVVEPNHQSFEYSLPHVIKEMQRATVNRFARVRLAQAMEQHLRLMDLVLEEEGGSNRFIILCPEADKEGSEVIIERIKAVMDQVKIPVECSRATFPEDALTFEGLVNQARAKLHPQEIRDSEVLQELDVYPAS